MRIRLELLRDRGEAADVGEQQGHVPHLAAEHEPARIFRELLDQRRRHVAAKGTAHLAALGLAAQEVDQRTGEVDGQHHQRRIHRVQELLELGVAVPGKRDRRGGSGSTQKRAPQRAEEWQKQRQRHAQHHHVGDFGSVAPVRPLEVVAEKHLLDRQGVDSNSGCRRIQRSRSQILEARCARPHQQDVAFHAAGIEILFEDLLRWDVALGHEVGEVDPDAGLRIGRHLDAADLDVIDPGMLAVGLLHVRTGRLDDEVALCSLYADRASHYWNTPEAGGKVDKDTPTQVGRALAQLGIELIPAYSPEARGRSERMFGTLQKRLPQELRLAGITDMAGANRFLKELFLPQHNARFATPAEDQGTAFVPFTGALDDILCIHEERTVSNDNTVRYKRLALQIPAGRHRRHYVKARVRVHEYPDSTMAVFHGPRCLARYHADGQPIDSQTREAA